MSKKVLLADDAELVRTKLKEFFVAEGFTVSEVENGRDASEIIHRENDFNLIITDLNMPFIDGMELTRQIRELEHYKKTPVFVLSTESTADLKKKGKEVGVTAWILKPFNPQSLRDIMKALKLI